MPETQLSIVSGTCAHDREMVFPADTAAARPEEMMCTVNEGARMVDVELPHAQNLLQPHADPHVNETLNGHGHSNEFVIFPTTHPCKKPCSYTGLRPLDALQST